MWVWKKAITLLFMTCRVNDVTACKAMHRAPHNRTTSRNHCSLVAGLSTIGSRSIHNAFCRPRKKSIGGRGTGHPWSVCAKLHPLFLSFSTLLLVFAPLHQPEQVSTCFFQTWSCLVAHLLDGVMLPNCLWMMHWITLWLVSLVVLLVSLSAFAACCMVTSFGCWCNMPTILFQPARTTCMGKHEMDTATGGWCPSFNFGRGHVTLKGAVVVPFCVCSVHTIKERKCVTLPFKQATI